MDIEAIVESRCSGERFLDLHPLNASRYLRFLLGKETTGVPQGDWWNEHEFILALHWNAPESQSLDEIGLDPISLDDFSKRCCAIVQASGGKNPERNDATSRYHADWIWCARFGNNVEKAATASRTIFSSINETFISRSILSHIVIGVHEYSARRLIERAHGDAVFLDKEALKQLGESVDTFTFRECDNKAYGDAQEALLRESLQPDQIAIPTGVAG